MGIKDKISRAFTAGKQNSLSQIMEQCPDKRPVKPPRKRMSDRAVSLISSALTIAMLIGGVFGGVVYFRNAFPDGIIHYDEPTIGPGLSAGSPSGPNHQVPVDTAPSIPNPNRDPAGTEWVPVDPPPTIDYPNTEEGYLIRTEDILYPYRDAIYYVPDAPVEYVVEYGFQKCRIVRTQDGYCIQFDFDIATGCLLSIDVLDCKCIKEKALSPYVACWIAYMDAAPEYYGATQHCTYDYTTSKNGIYLITITEPTDSTYYIDNKTGEILNKLPSEELVLISRQEALELAFEYLDMDMTEANYFYISRVGGHDFDFPVPDDLLYVVTIESETEGYSIFIEAVEGAILLHGTGTYNPDTAPPFSEFITAQQARDNALQIHGIDIASARAVKVYLEHDIYTVYYEYGEYCYAFEVSAVDGSIVYDYGTKMILVPKWETLSLPVSWEKARDLALDACGRTIYELLEFTVDFSDNAYGQVYWLEMRFEDDYYTYRIDAATGEFLNLTDSPLLPDELIGEAMALEFAIIHNQLQNKYTAGIISDVAIKLDTRDTPPVYWVYFKVNEKVSYEVCIHGYNGQMLLLNTYDNDNIYTELEAIEVARRYASTSGELMGSVLLSGGDFKHFYLVWFNNIGSTVYVMVDASTLRCMDSSITFPDNAINKREALDGVFKYLGDADWESDILLLQGVYNDGTPYYCVILHEKEFERFILVDGFTGSITTDISVEKDANP